ncbi:MAG: histidinol dehydrogenase, partial [Kiritimatiellae bacterium]|nr:histidinol dehydrogenase [Kiritimatiellia bacterium]
MSVKILKLNDRKQQKVIERFLARPAFDPKSETVAREVLDAVKKDGNRAVVKYAKMFDKVSLRVGDFKVTRRELNDARVRVSDDIQLAIRESRKRVVEFSRNGMRKDWRMGSPKGGTLGEQFMPLDRVGIYVPGGEAPLVSTVLMTVTLAKVAGVQEIVVCTPCKKGRKLNDGLLYALDVAGATEIYKVGGIQAIGMMAYGTSTMRKVQKIAGPGGTYVTAAKRLVYGDVALDLVAGPSEIAILADHTADSRYVAADMLSQAEHGTGWERAVLVTSSEKLAMEVAVQLDEQSATLSRQKAIQKVMDKGMLIVVVGHLDEGMDFCNKLAPEHLELMMDGARNWLKKVRSAGAVFLGMWSPECT